MIREGICQSCSQEYYTPWSTDNETWNKVVGHTLHFLCPNCFLNLAKIAGIETSVYITFNTDQEERIAELESELVGIRNLLEAGAPTEAKNKLDRILNV